MKILGKGWWGNYYHLPSFSPIIFCSNYFEEKNKYSYQIPFLPCHNTHTRATSYLSERETLSEDITAKNILIAPKIPPQFLSTLVQLDKNT